MEIMHETITVETVKAEVGGYPHIAVLVVTRLLVSLSYSYNLPLMPLAATVIRTDNEAMTMRLNMLFRCSNIIEVTDLEFCVQNYTISST